MSDRIDPLTDSERRAVAYFADVCRDDLVPDEWTVNAGVLRSLLSRAGSPPVVEVPATCPSVYGFDSPFSNGQYRAGHREACLMHRDALDAAGVAWKEVPRE